MAQDTPLDKLHACFVAFVEVDGSYKGFKGIAAEVTVV